MFTRIYAEDQYWEVAQKIYDDLEVNQSCVITGFITLDDEEVYTKGELVIKELTKLYYDNAMYNNGGGRMRMKQRRIPGSIGGYVAHKIWRFQITDKTKYTIWRVQ